MGHARRGFERCGRASRVGIIFVAGDKKINALAPLSGDTGIEGETIVSESFAADCLGYRASFRPAGSER